MQRFFLLLLLLPILLRAQPSGVHPGLSLDSFRLLMPGVVPDDAGYEGSPSERTDAYGLNAFREYSFRKGYLKTVRYWSSMILQRGVADKKENAEKFSTCRTGTINLLRDCISRYGTPTTLDSVLLPKFSPGDSVWTTTLLRATWNIDSVTIDLKMGFSSSYPRPGAPPREYHPNDYVHPDSYDVALSYNGMGKVPNEIFRLGMKADVLAKMKPALFPHGTGIANSWQKKEKQFGLDGAWTFRFENSVLTGYAYDATLNDWNETKPFSKKEIKTISTGAHRMESEMTKRYGTPLYRSETTDSIYTLQNKSHWKAEPLQVSWKTKDAEVRLRYSGSGGWYKGVPAKRLTARLSFCDPSGKDCDESD